MGILEGSDGDRRLEKHPEKTSIGRIERGFDTRLSPQPLKAQTAAMETMERFGSCAVRLYEQDRREPSGSPLFGLYVRRAVGAWVSVGLHSERY
jgi:hypothetical protein